MRALRHTAPTVGVSIALIAPGGTGNSFQLQFPKKAHPLTRLNTETGMLDEAARKSFRSLGIPLQSPDYVAQAALFLASNPEHNGKGLTLIGSVATEVEGPLLETQPTWYGKYNLEAAAKAANVNYNR